MAVRLSCPSCNAGLKIGESSFGKKRKCPKCGHRFRAPGNPSEPPFRGEPPPDAAEVDWNDLLESHKREQLQEDETFSFESERSSESYLPWLLSLVALAIGTAAGSLLLVPFGMMIGLPLAVCSVVLAGGAITTRHATGLASLALAVGIVIALIFTVEAVKFQIDMHQASQNAEKAIRDLGLDAQKAIRGLDAQKAGRSSRVRPGRSAPNATETSAQETDEGIGGVEKVEEAYKRIATESIKGNKAKPVPEGNYGLGLDGKWHLLPKKTER
jgi:predicted Zn finger-like uncharacterized protein